MVAPEIPSTSFILDTSLHLFLQRMVDIDRITEGMFP
jgi:hypothetical protein